MMNLTDIRTVKSLLSKYGFHFLKGLGQNFLIDETVCPKIAKLGGATSGHGILEIGPGIGTLTQQLALHADKVAAIELDKRLFPMLEETVGEFKNLHIIHGDILQQNISQILEQEFPDIPVSVCANLPYYITTPILMHLLESGANVDAITVMVQKEVADKLQAKVGTREAGAITIAINYYGTVEQLFSVPRTSFMPEPNVDSAVIQIQVKRRYTEMIKDERHFFSMVKCGFSQRRKMISNSLAATMGYDKEMLEQLVLDLDLPWKVRIEQLTMDQLIELSNRLCMYHSKE